MKNIARHLHNDDDNDDYENKRKKKKGQLKIFFGLLSHSEWNEMNHFLSLKSKPYCTYI
jgi:hypothetical protein